MESFIPYDINRTCREGQKSGYTEPKLIYFYGPFAAALSSILVLEEDKSAGCCGKQEESQESVTLYRGLRLTSSQFNDYYASC